MPPRQGEIYWVDLDPARGHEQRGRRPGLVISRNELNDLPLTVFVMAGTSADRMDASRRYPTDVWVTAAEAGIPKDTVFLGLQMRSVDASRLGAKIGDLPQDRIPEVWAASRFVLGDDR
jgi:mRNA interferase MazF